ncbi:hypothetical protein C8R47DRAFT_1184162 [Mycena vitilis]|nr:hypothetical protein C8R47DRAFT_1184162 [Mycena vitilis]
MPAQSKSSQPRYIMDFDKVLLPVNKLCCLLVAWLNLHARISRRTANIVLQALHLILVTALQLVFTVLQSSGFEQVKPPEFKLPKDIRTIYQQGMEPEIIRTACCPNCYSMYPADAPIPTICRYKKSPKAGECETPLWRERKTRKGVKRVPERLYSAQSFESWLRFFLARPEIEDHLEKSALRSQNRPPPGNADVMHDIQDSPAWRSLGNFVWFPYNLVWAVYIRFPRGRGKVVSCGLIILYCLNLPIELRFLLQNVFIVGLIPGPGMPDVWQISHVLDSFVARLNAFKAPGKKVPTHRHPDGTVVQCCVVPLIADLGAIRKVAGDGDTVKAQANTWLQKTTLVARNAWSTATGVRWTPTHDLTLWDPVKHTVLEGIAAHHLRMLWGISRKSGAALDLKEQEKEEKFSESDASEASEDLEGLTEEMNTPLEELMDVDSYREETRTSVTPTPQNPGTRLRDVPLGEGVDVDSDDEDFILPGFESDTGAFNFTSDEMDEIHRCIKEVQLPTWVGRPPTNLGEASHGKLKAQELLTLFTVIFPLVIPELWWNKRQQLLDNYHHLIYGPLHPIPQWPSPAMAAN